jgi:hypothetical protein
MQLQSPPVKGGKREKKGKRKRKKHDRNTRMQEKKSAGNQAKNQTARVNE